MRCSAARRSCRWIHNFVMGHQGYNVTSGARGLRTLGHNFAGLLWYQNKLLVLVHLTLWEHAYLPKGHIGHDTGPRDPPSCGKRELFSSHLHTCATVVNCGHTLVAHRSVVGT